MTMLVPYTPPSTEEWGQLAQTAAAVSRTDMVPRAVRGNEGAVLAILLTGRELGIGPMQALREIHVIEGKPAPSAQLQIALVRRAGHRIWTAERSDKLATIAATRLDQPDELLTVTWTIEDAQRAKLAGKDNWLKYPRRMLWARAVTEMVHTHFSEVIFGLLPDLGPAEEYEPEAEWGEPEQSGGTVAGVGEGTRASVSPDPTPDGGEPAPPLPPSGHRPDRTGVRPGPAAAASAEPAGSRSAGDPASSPHSSPSVPATAPGPDEMAARGASDAHAGARPADDPAPPTTADMADAIKAAGLKDETAAAEYLAEHADMPELAGRATGPMKLTNPNWPGFPRALHALQAAAEGKAP